MVFKIVKRQDESEIRWSEQYYWRLFIHGTYRDKDVDYSCSFQLKDTRSKGENRKIIRELYLSLFAHKEERNQHTEAKLFKLHSEVNTVAKIKALHTTL